MSLKVLLVEDEAMIALQIEDMLEELGHEVATAMRLPDALDAVERDDFDFAILDVNLAGETSFPVADALSHRGVPYAFATGYGRVGISPPYDEHLVIEKPVGRADLHRALRGVTH